MAGLFSGHLKEPFANPFNLVGDSFRSQTAPAVLGFLCLITQESAQEHRASATPHIGRSGPDLQADVLGVASDAKAP